MASSLLGRLLCGGALMLAGACREGADIEVTQTADRVVFTVAPLDGSFEACIKTAYVYSVGATGERLIWDATRGLKTRPCLHSIAYRSDPDGFRAAVPPALRSGQTYRVALLGPGFNEEQVFVRH